MSNYLSSGRLQTEQQHKCDLPSAFISNTRLRNIASRPESSPAPQSFSKMDYLLSSTYQRNESLSSTVSLMSTSYPFSFNPLESQSGLIKILNEKLAIIGDLFSTYFMTYIFICTLLENCMLGFDTLYVTQAEMFPD